MEYINTPIMARRMPNVKILVGLIFLGLGFIFAAIGAITFFSTQSAINSGHVVQGEIVEINYRGGYGSRNSRHYDVMVSYEIDGTAYVSVLNEYSSDMYEGKSITLYYDPANPYNVTSGLLSTFGIVFICIGSAFIIAGGMLVAVFLRKKGIQRRLLEHGRYTEIPITGIETAYNVHINGMHPLYIRCDWVDPNTGVPHMFKSEYFRDDIGRILADKGITAMQVYFDEYKPKQYYMDTSFLHR